MHSRTILARFFSQLTRGERCAGQSVPASFGADVENGITDAMGGAARELFMAQHAETEDIYKRIALETFVEINFATNGRHANAVAVMRNAGDDASEEAAVCCNL